MFAPTQRQEPLVEIGMAENPSISTARQRIFQLMRSEAPYPTPRATVAPAPMPEQVQHVAYKPVQKIEPRLRYLVEYIDETDEVAFLETAAKSFRQHETKGRSAGNRALRKH